MPRDREAKEHDEAYERHRRKAEQTLNQLDTLIAEHAAAIHRLRLLLTKETK